MKKQYKPWLAGILAAILILSGSVPAYASETEETAAEIFQTSETEMTEPEETDSLFETADEALPGTPSQESAEGETEDPQNETADPSEEGSSQEETAAEEQEELSAAPEEAVSEDQPFSEENDPMTDDGSENANDPESENTEDPGSEDAEDPESEDPGSEDPADPSAEDRETPEEKPVEKKPLALLDITHTSKAYTGEPLPQTNALIVTDEKGLVLKNGRDYTVSYKNNIDVGKAKVIVTGCGDYQGTLEGYFEIRPRSIADMKALLSTTHCTYNGELRKPVVKVKDGKKVLVKGTDYTVTYKRNRNVGMAAVVIKGTGNYKGKITRNFRITPDGTYLRSLKVGHKSITVTWKPQETQITGYQLRYSTDPDFGTYEKKSVPAGNTEKTLTGLTPGSKYYIQLRTYKKIDGVNFYSGWCNVRKKTIKTNTLTVIKDRRFMTIRMINPSEGLTDVKANVYSKINGTDDMRRISLKKQADGSYKADFYYNNLWNSGTCNISCYNGNDYLSKTTVDVTDGDRFLARWLFGGDSRIDFIQCAINIARNNSIGYGHTWPRTISCAGLVGLTLTYCGYGDFIKTNPLGWGYLDLGTYSGHGYNWRHIMQNEVGATWHAGIGELQPGDILYYDYGYYNNHTGIYAGEATVEARGPGSGSNADESGAEVAVYGSWSFLPWQGYFRIPQAKIHYRW